MIRILRLAAIAAGCFYLPIAAAAQKISAFPSAAPLSGGEHILGAQGAGCASQSDPCPTVKITPAQIGTYLAPTIALRVPATRQILTTSPLLGGGDLTADRTLSIATFGAGAAGIVPASGGGSTAFLRADGAWVAPPAGAGTVTSVSATGSSGITASVTSASTTPAIAISLGTVAIANGGTGATSPGAALTALGAQPAAGNLSALAGLGTAADNCGYWTGSATAALYACPSFGRGLVGSASVTAARSTLGLGSLATQSGTFSGTSSGTNTGDQTITLTGDVTGTGTGSFAATIANGAVTNAKMASMAAYTVRGNATNATATPADLTQAQLTGLVQTFTSSLSGAVPSSGGGTANYLRADGTWAAPPGGGGAGTVTSVSVTTANGVSGTVANASSTPAISLTLGAITPSSVAASGAVSGSNLSGTNTGDQTSVSGNAGTATKLATARTLAITGDLAWTSPAFDGSGAVTAAGTLATSGVTAGSYGSVTAVPVLAIDAKGRVTSASTAAIGAAAAQTYVEGTWTPDVQFGGSNAGFTYNGRTGRYTRIGRMVTIEVNIAVNAKGSGSGSITIAGLPYANNSSLLGCGVVPMSKGVANIYGWFVAIGAGASTLSLYANSAASPGNYAASDAGQMTAGAELYFSCSYSV